MGFLPTLATIAMDVGAPASVVGAVQGVSGLSALGTAASIAGTGLGALGNIQSAKAQSAAAGYNAQLAARNAEIATQNAEAAGAKGEADVGVQAAKTRAEAGALLAQQGASGVDVNKGSSLGVQQSQAELNKLDAMTIRSNAAREAYGYQTQATTDLAQSKLYKSQQKSDNAGGYLNAGATILGGIGKQAEYENWLTKGDPTAGITF